MYEVGKIDKDVWAALGDVYAFMGNSLLSPMNQTSDIGISAEFWNGFPRFQNEHAKRGIERLLTYVSQDFESVEKAIERCAVEHTKLFVGPPEPAAAPWETMNKGGEVTVGFGEATFAMRRRLHAIGLEIGATNNQYEDHIGIELLYLSVLCGRLTADADEAVVDADEILEFIEAHPLSWIENLRRAVEEVYPQGYFGGLLELVQGVLEFQRDSMKEASTKA